MRIRTPKRELLRMTILYFFFQAEDGIRDIGVTGSSDVCSSDLLQDSIQSSLMAGPVAQLVKFARSASRRPGVRQSGSWVCTWHSMARPAVVGIPYRK